MKLKAKCRKERLRPRPEITQDHGEEKRLLGEAWFHDSHIAETSKNEGGGTL
jgi:hypothetical protein